jgi:hypothetical protein
MAKKIRWWDAAEIIGVTNRTMRRWRERLEAEGYSGLVDRRKGKPSDKRVPVWSKYSCGVFVVFEQATESVMTCNRGTL